jgi:hypothetical protein
MNVLFVLLDELPHLSPAFQPKTAMLLAQERGT